jgi:hippurate hydrolase
MLYNDPVAEITPEVVAWRHTIHAHPELGFQEHRTAALVAEQLRSFGIEVHEGIAGTGVVGVLRKGAGGRSIGLRAELDALPIVERADVPYASTANGVMHACGHDGHTAMLLGAAKLLSQSTTFDGTVHFVFQPAEENEGGSMRMIEAGLFERFPVEAVYSVHNWPGLPFGEIHTRAGPMMAAVDMFEVHFTGTGAHAAMPHLGDDPILAASAFVGSVQRVVSRSVDPQMPLVVSITQIHGGNVGNVVPGKVWLQGTCRFFDPGLSAQLERRIGAIATGIASAHGVTASLDYRVGYPPLFNTQSAATHAVEAAAATVGRDKVVTDINPSLGCEDFAYMVRAAGGAYVWVGTGPAKAGEGLHGDCYVFNDAIVPIVLRYWVNLVEQSLAVAGQ